MAKVTEGTRSGEFIASEANGHRSRETIVVGVGIVYPGQVLGKVTADGNHAAFAQDAEDGTEAAAGIAYHKCDATGGPVKTLAVVRDCEVNGNDLLWPADIEAAEQTAAIAQLAALGIIVRT